MSAPDGRALVQPDPFGCADEPIHMPGAIQPHGVLLAATEPDHRVVMASANTAAVLGAGPEDLVGRPLDDIVGEGRLDDLLNPFELELAGRLHDAIVHRADGLVVVELEPVAEHAAVVPAWFRPLRPALARLHQAGSITELAETVATTVHQLTGFDRVMVYRFDPAWNGEVVAEVRRPDLEPFLGLRYPSTDIPAQARALYERNWLRLIPDARYEPVRLVPDRNPLTGRPLDLSDAVLRSVSPVHLEYLANMGVVASMSASLMREGQLWGLVACHHYSGPHLPRYDARAAVEFVAQAASVLLEAKERSGADAVRTAVAQVETELFQALVERRSSPVSALTDDSVTITDLVGATGAAVRIGREVRQIGATPDPEVIDELAEMMWRGGRTTYATASLSAVDARWEAIKDVASGALGVRLGHQSDQYILWFRPEKLQSVQWGGDPTTPKLVEDERGLRLSPRRSFARYTELVRLHAEPWADREVAAAERLGTRVSQLLVGLAAERDEVWAALQRTLLAENLPSVPGFAFAARYFPGGSGPVGGDWYDVIHLPNGHTVITVGDVAGHGLSVAAVSAQFRLGLRAYVLREQSAGIALERLNDLAHWLLPEELVTVLVVDVDPATRTMRWANAGHVPAVIVDDGGVRLERGRRGPALGLTEEVTYDEEEMALAGDSTVVLFTDGLVEERGQPLDDGLRRLSDETARSGQRDPEALCERITAAFGAAARSDDVTLVAFRLSPAATVTA